MGSYSPTFASQRLHHYLTPLCQASRTFGTWGVIAISDSTKSDSLVYYDVKTGQSYTHRVPFHEGVSHRAGKVFHTDCDGQSFGSNSRKGGQRFAWPTKTVCSDSGERWAGSWYPACRSASTKLCWLSCVSILQHQDAPIDLKLSSPNLKAIFSPLHLIYCHYWRFLHLALDLTVGFSCGSDQPKCA